MASTILRTVPDPLASGCEGPAQIASFVERSGLRLDSEHRSWPSDADGFYMAKLTRSDTA